MAAIGARKAVSSSDTMLPPPFPPRPKIALSWANCATDVMTPATAAATEDVRMSRL